MGPAIAARVGMCSIELSKQVRIAMHDGVLKGESEAAALKRSLLDITLFGLLIRVDDRAALSDGIDIIFFIFCCFSTWGT